MEYLKEYGCQQELKSPILHTDKIIQGTPCIERIEYTKVNFSMNNMKDENKTKQEQAGNTAAI